MARASNRKRTVKKRSAQAKALADRRYRPRVVADKRRRVLVAGAVFDPLELMSYNRTSVRDVE